MLPVDEMQLEPPAALDAETDATYATGRLLVKFRDLPEAAVRNAAAAENTALAGEIPGIGVRVLQLPPQASEMAALRAFRQRPDVVFAEIDERRAASLVPNDTYYPTSWHLPRISAPQAWDATTGSNNIVIAILDTGCDPAHPDLAAKYVPGWNFFDNNADSSDVHGHGTSVAGAAAAQSNNGAGVAAPAWGCRIMPVRVSDLDGYANASTVANALVWAADHGARVANVSYAFNTSTTVASAAQYFQSRGGVVTMSAGNSGIFVTNGDNPYILTISATDSSDLLASWSTRGNFLDLAAPGVSIRTTLRNAGYGSGSGTSFSAPIVAGVAALALSVNPGLSDADVQQVLKSAADDLGPAGWDSDYGWGRLNAAAAVQLAAGFTGDVTAPSVSFAAPAAGATVSGVVAVQVNAADDVGVASVSLYVDGVLFAADTAAPFAFNWGSSRVGNGAHVLRAVASDAAGNTAAAEQSINVSNFVDTTAPTVAITAPADGAQIGNSVSVTVNAADNVGVSRVELWVDGVLKATSTRAPYSTSWNSRRASRGAHALECRAYDAAGNMGRSATVTVYK